MSVPPEVQAMHLRQFDAYISALVTRLTETDEHYNFIALCERIERLLSIDQQFYEDREEPRVVETTPIISPPAEQAWICAHCKVPTEECWGHGCHVWDSYQDSPADEQPKEEPVRAEPTMTPEELAGWQARVNAGDSPQLSKQKLSWTPERRAAQAETARRAGQLRNASRNGPPPKAFSLKGPEAAPVQLTKEAENAALLDTPLELLDDETVALLRAATSEDSSEVHQTPEEAAHEDAALILAELEPPPAKASASVADALPDCTCLPTWWTDAPRGSGTPRIPSSKHNGECPLHRHRFKLPQVPVEGNYISTCECGEVKSFPVEPERSLNKKPAAVSA